MSRSAGQIADEIRMLRPSGFASPRQPDDWQAAVDQAAANELALIEASMEAMLPEADPASAINLLPDYERVLGPDPYGRDLSSMTIGRRQEIAAQRWTEAPVMCAGYFVALAASLEQTIAIDEFPLWECGVGECGTEPVPWSVHLQFVVVLPTTVEWFSECGVLEAGEPTSGSEADFMEPIVRREAPLHTLPVFNYRAINPPNPPGMVSVVAPPGSVGALAITFVPGAIDSTHDAALSFTANAFNHGVDMYFPGVTSGSVLTGLPSGLTYQIHVQALNGAPGSPSAFSLSSTGAPN